MGRKILTQLAAGEIRRLRALVNDWGEPLHSYAEIAHMLGVSESTVGRVCTARAAYAEGRRGPGQSVTMEQAHAAVQNMPPDSLSEAAAESARRVLELVQKPAPDSRFIVPDPFGVVKERK